MLRSLYFVATNRANLSLKEWSIWLGELPWSLRWFPLLVLLRPLVDNLFFLKEVSPFLSPPYIVGVLSPLLCLLALVRFKHPRFGAGDKAFYLWGGFLLLSSLLVLLQNPLDLVSIEFMLKLSMPVYLFALLRILIRSRRDLNGILFSFLYSAIFVAAILLYEILVSPISLEESRGLQRIQGSFGDVVSYGMYIAFTSIITIYHYLSQSEARSAYRALLLLIGVAVINILGLFNIHHTATYGVFLTLVGMFFLFNFTGKNQGTSIVLLASLVLVLSFIGSELVSEKISPLLETDLAVYQGEKESDKLLHGRVGRWRLMLDNFFMEAPHLQIFGLTLGLQPVFPYIGIGSHNDFFRILFATGFLGLGAYLLFLLRIIAKARKQVRELRFLTYATLTALIFYSISITPTFYAPFLYMALSVFAFTLLPSSSQSP